MYAVLSPAKKLVVPTRTITPSEPVFTGQAGELITIMRQQSPDDLASLMKLSEKLAQLNFERFQLFDDSQGPESTTPAALTFAGDTYVGFEAATLTDTDLDFAQETIGILSGLYGLLRPLDSIQPYRLEMGTKVQTQAGQGLYRFWGESIAKEIKGRLDGHGERVLINLASKEYFGAVPLGALDCRVITPVFKELRDGKAKVISFLAKRARGSMARFIVQNRVTRPDDLKAFNTDGYRYEAQLSDSDEWTYVRSA